jgi:hypothetical protein
MARWGIFVTTAIAVALAVPNVAFADQKKPIKSTTTSGTISVRKAGKDQQEYLRGSTGPTVPPKPVGGAIAAPKLGGSTGPTVPPKPTQGNINR